MDEDSRVAAIGRFAHRLYVSIRDQSIAEQETLGKDEPPIHVMLTNSGLDKQLYIEQPEHRRLQNRLDGERYNVFKYMLEKTHVLVVMGDPRLDELKRYTYVCFNADEGPLGPWSHEVGGKQWRGEQAEAWLYEAYLRTKTNAETPRVILVSAYPEPPYHRVRAPELPEILIEPLQIPARETVVLLPRKTRTFDPVHPSWPNGVSWIPGVLACVEYQRFRLCGIGVEKAWYHGRNPKNSIRDLWMIENCADIVVAFHNGESASAKANFDAAAHRGIPAILVTFDDPKRADSRRVESANISTPE